MSVTAPETQPGAAPEPPAAVFQAPPEPPPAAEPAASEPAQAAEPAQPGQDPQGDPEPASVDQLPDWAQREFRKLRKENGESRVKAKETADALTAFRAEQDAQRDRLAQALGLKPEEVTPEQLAAERDAAKTAAEQAAQRARQSDVRLAVLQQAFAAQADGNALLDSVGFLRTVDALDPAADDFGARVKDAIAAAVEANPRYKADAGPPAPPAPAPAPMPQPQVPASGPGQGFTSPPAGPRQWTMEDVARATPAQLSEAIDAGLLENEGFGAARRSRR